MGAAPGGDTGGQASRVARASGNKTAAQAAQSTAGGIKSSSIYFPGRGLVDPAMGGNTLVATPNGQFADAAPGNSNNQLTYNMPSLGVPVPPAASQAPQAAAPTQSIGDLVTAILAGQGVTAPTAVNGSQFFSSTPYTQALASLASGNKSAQGTIGGAYDTAAAQDKTYQQQATQQAAAGAQQQAATTGLLNGQLGSIIQNAEHLAGGGPGLGANMSFLSALSNLQDKNAANIGGQQAQMVANDNGAFGQALAGNRAGALSSLASSVSGQQNRIGLAEANDQAKANSTAASFNAKQNADYQHAYQSVVKQAQTKSSSIDRDNANQTLAQWATEGNQGNQSSAALYNTAYQLLNGKNPDGSTIAGGSGTPLGSAKSLGEVMSRLGGSGVAKGSYEYNLLTGLFNNYYSTGSSTSTMDALKAMAGVQ